MPRLLVHVEGQTEEAFVGEILRDHLVPYGYGVVAARLLGNPRLRSRRGGIRSWESVKSDILRHLKQDPGAIATTMVDYYALPSNWPGRTEAIALNSSTEKAERVEMALCADVRQELGGSFDPRRFAPLVMMHEFEALLFSEPAQFAMSIGKNDLSNRFAEIRQSFSSPEDINDSTQTAPSKRISDLFPEYEKPLYGVIAAIEIGLTRMRQECQHFNSWLDRLEALPGECAYLG
jgi:hypothetical protein